MFFSVTNILSAFLLSTGTCVLRTEAGPVASRGRRGGVRGQNKWNAVPKGNRGDIDPPELKLSESRLLGIGDRLADAMVPEYQGFNNGYNMQKKMKMDKLLDNVKNNNKEGFNPKQGIENVPDDIVVGEEKQTEESPVDGESMGETIKPSPTQATEVKPPLPSDKNQNENENTEESPSDKMESSPTSSTAVEPPVPIDASKNEGNTQDFDSSVSSGINDSNSKRVEEADNDGSSTTGATNNEEVEGGNDQDPSPSADAQDLICLSIASQNPITSPSIEDQTTSEYISISSTVSYHSDITFPEEIEYHLDSTNPSMAIYIADCEEKLGLSAPAHKALRKARFLEDKWTPIITYVELGPWSASGPCDSDSSENISNNIAFVDELISLQAPSELLCEQPFSTRIEIRIQTVGDDQASRVSEYIQNQINTAFSAVIKPTLESQPGIIGVELTQAINEELIIDGFNSVSDEEYQARKRRNTILACSVVVACIFMFFAVVFLVRLYQRRRKEGYAKYVSARSGHVTHALFEDEIGVLGGESDDDARQESNENLADGLEDNTAFRINKLHGLHHQDKPQESDTDEDEFDYDYESDVDTNPPPPPPSNTILEINPCPYEPRPGIGPFDEQIQYQYPDQTCSSPTCTYCEQRRQMGPITKANSTMTESIDNSGNTRLDREPDTISLAHSERVFVTIDAESSKRNYTLEDLMKL